MREFSAPAAFTVADDESSVDVVFEFEKTEPRLTVFEKLVGSDWEPVSAADFAQEVRAAAKGLIALGIKPGDRIGLMSATRYEWSLLGYAIWAAGAIGVPIYETSSTGQVEWILTDSGAVALIIEDDKHAEVVAPLLDASPELRTVLQIEAGTHSPDGAIAQLAAAGADIADADVAARVAGLTADTAAILIYTSGTTGRPKGCQLTHRNLLAEARGDLQAFATLLIPGKRLLMFLPMAHVLAHAISLAAFQAKVSMGHFADIPNLVPTFGTFKPDFILSVPRVFEKVYNAARQTAHDGGRLKGAIFDFADRTAVAWSEALDTPSGPSFLLNLQHSICDKLVYSKLKTVLGNRCTFAISGGAPLGVRLGHFFRGMGMTIYEGYGLTESTAAIAVNTPEHIRVGSVGQPVPGNEVRIADDGEVLLRGGAVFDGYWRNEEATAAAIVDGWFHTGDLGALDAQGYLTITGRKKEIIVTAGGKNVAPAGLEDDLRAHALISQAMVVGDQKPFIAALITIDTDAFPAWKARNGKPEGASIGDLALDPDLLAVIEGAVAKANLMVSHAEAIKKFTILPVDFTEETGEITPTLKLKRNVVAEKFADDIDGLYFK